MAHHRIVIQTRPAPGPVTIEGEEAHHAARVKRLGEGDTVELLDGHGSVATALIVGISKPRGEWRLELDITEVHTEPPLAPRVEVYAPAPKGPRLADMVDALSQVGAAAWFPLETARTIAEPRAGRLGRLDRTALEAAKQCGRAWLLEVGAATPLERALVGAPGAAVVVADASGGAYRATGAGTVRLLVGPEGGWTPAELDLARAAGALVHRFGPHILRIETAAPTAAAIVLDHERRG